MKRFTETTKWEDPWYRKLSPQAKHLWQWLLDHCDNAGVIEVDLELATFQVGETIKAEHLAEIESRFETIGQGKLWIRKFIPFQWGAISEKCLQHRPVFNSIIRHGLNLQQIKVSSTPIERALNAHSKPIQSPVHGAKVQVQVQEKEKERGGVGETGGVGGIPENDEWAGKWLAEARKSGADYTQWEMRTALLALKANGFKWGTNQIVDHRAALERQIQTDRQRKTKPAFIKPQSEYDRQCGL